MLEEELERLDFEKGANEMCSFELTWHLSRDVEVDKTLACS